MKIVLNKDFGGFIGIEMDEEYFKIAKDRLHYDFEDLD